MPQPSRTLSLARSAGQIGMRRAGEGTGSAFAIAFIACECGTQKSKGEGTMRSIRKQTVTLWYWNTMEQRFIDFHFWRRWRN